MAELIKTLVIDDEEGMRLGIERVLGRYVTRLDDMDTEAKFDVQTAADGQETIKLLSEQSFDLVLIDYKLPDITGIEILEQLATAGGDAVSIMVTAYASLETAISATKKGAFDFLAKPFTPEELKAVVRKATHHLLVSRKVRALAEEKKRIRFEFISVLSHELKAPLGAVEGYLNLIKDGVVKSDSDKMDQIVSRSISRIQGMRKLILDLLDLTQIEAGNKARSLSPVNVEEIARTAIETLEPEAAKREIEVRLETAANTTIWADKMELEIIFNNLISNAVKYNVDGGRVLVKLSEAAHVLTIEVQDTGIGLSAEEMGRLFKDFSRIKNSKTRSIPGSGLGLSTLKKLADLYGGDVHVKSAENQGSTFTVTLKANTEPGAGAMSHVA